MEKNITDIVSEDRAPGSLMKLTHSKGKPFTGELLKQGIPDSPEIEVSMGDFGLCGQIVNSCNRDMETGSLRGEIGFETSVSEESDMDGTSVTEELRYFEKLVPKPSAMVFSYLKKAASIISLDGVPHLFEPDRGIYSAITVSADEMLLRNLPDIISKKVLCSNMVDVAKRFSALRYSYPQVIWLKNQQVERYIKFKNGVLDLTSGEIIETENFNMASYYMTHEINAKYLEDGGECPLFDNFLSTSFAGCEDEIPLVWAMIGVVISNIRSLKKAFFLHGANDSGKSILASVLSGLVGSDYTSALRLEDFGGDFHPSALVGKYLNIGAEMTFGKLKNIAEFKAFVSGGTDLLDMKIKHKSSRMIVNTALMVFPMNNLPELPADQDIDSLFSRIQIVSMPNTIPEKDRIPDLEYKLKREYDAIVYRAVQALRNVIAAGIVLPESTTSSDAMNKYRIKSNGLDVRTAFISECLEYIPESTISSATIRAAYENYCKINDFPDDSPKSWVKILQEYWGKPVKSTKFTVRTHHDTVGIQGVALKDKGI